MWVWAPHGKGRGCGLWMPGHTAQQERRHSRLSNQAVEPQLERVRYFPSRAAFNGTWLLTLFLRIAFSEVCASTSLTLLVWESEAGSLAKVTSGHPGSPPCVGPWGTPATCPRQSASPRLALWSLHIPRCQSQPSPRPTCASSLPLPVFLQRCPPASSHPPPPAHTQADSAPALLQGPPLWEAPPHAPCLRKRQCCQEPCPVSCHGSGTGPRAVLLCLGPSAPSPSPGVSAWVLVGAWGIGTCTVWAAQRSPQGPGAWQGTLGVH